MNETKYVDKICPLFGSHLIPVQGKLSGLPGQIVFGGQQQLSLCQKDKCELWDEEIKECSQKNHASITSAIYAFSVSIEECLNHINDSIRDHLKEKHGNS